MTEEIKIAEYYKKAAEFAGGAMRLFFCGKMDIFYIEGRGSLRVFGRKKHLHCCELQSYFSGPTNSRESKAEILEPLSGR